MSFLVRVDLPPKRNISGFRRELWEDDVAELFLWRPPMKSGHCTRYLEFNFAPGGAWWAASFHGVARANKEELPGSVEIVESEVGPKSWSVQARISFPGIDRMPLKGNVCGVFGENPRRYVSWSPLDPEKIDFHCPRRFGHILPWESPLNDTFYLQITPPGRDPEFVRVDHRWIEDIEALEVVAKLTEDERLALPIAKLRPSVRLANFLANAEIETVGELVAKPTTELMKFRSSTAKPLHEARIKLAVIGLELR